MSDKHKVCWVTGASSGIGEAAAQALAGHGHTVVLSARGKERLDESVERIRGAGGLAEGICVDVTQQDEVRAAAQEIQKRFGRIDVLLANAGLNVGKRAWGEVAGPDFERLVQVNLNGVFFCVDAVLPGMRERRSGLVVNVASWAGKFPSAKPGPAYTAAKAAVVALTASLNMSEYVNNIRACAISPAEVATPAMARRIPPVPAEVLERMLKPEDVAAAVCFVVNMPERACVNEIVLSPTLNGAFGPAAPPQKEKIL